MEELDFDVVILGAGSGGMGVAYALKKYIDSIDKDNSRKYKIAIVDKNRELGGTATLGWVTTWLQGLIPPHMEVIIKDFTGLTAEKQREDYWLRDNFAKDKENPKNPSLYIDGVKLAKRYKVDMKGFANLILNNEIVDAGSSNGVVEYVVIQNINSRKRTKLRSKYFVDSTGDGVLCRLVGNDYLCGRDLFNKFHEESAQKDETKETKCINEASLLYKIENNRDDSELLNSITTVLVQYTNSDKITSISKPDYISKDGFASLVPENGNMRVINPMTGESNNSYNILIADNPQKAYDIYSKHLLEHWKFVKYSCQKEIEAGNANFGAYGASLYKFGYVDQAPLLGIRESYRIVCDTMMTQEDMTHLITPEEVETNGFVGESSHIVDIHLSEGLRDIDKFNNQKLRPYGIKYKALIPKDLKNVLIASRCYGASQIFLSGARGNFTMSYLGYSVGTAIGLCLQGGLTDVRCVDVAKVQKLSEFIDRVASLQGLYKEGL
jgi:hypothetical protein